MKYSLLLLPFLASGALAQDDVWKSLNQGDRVSVTFRSGNQISGQLASKPSDPRIPQEAVDYSKATEITLDVSLEYPGLNGTLTIPRKEVKEIRKLANLDAATMKRIQEEINRIKAQSAADDATRRSAEAERDRVAQKAREEQEKINKELDSTKNKGQAAVKDLEDLQKGLELLKRFPPEQYGPDTAKQVADKALRKQPVTPAETEFLDAETQRLWKKALEHQKAQQEKKTDGK